MPSVCRRIAALLAVACLGVALPAQIASAQSAGDQQYSDPFAGSGSSTTRKDRPKRTSSPPARTPRLSQNPQSYPSVPATAPSTAVGTSPDAPSATPAPVRRQLPNTGLDARVLLLLGAALLLGGLGLRLRSTPERF